MFLLPSKFEVNRPKHAQDIFKVYEKKKKIIKKKNTKKIRQTLKARISVKAGQIYSNLEWEVPYAEQQKWLISIHALSSYGYMNTAFSSFL